MFCTHHAANLFHFPRLQLQHMMPHGEVSSVHWDSQKKLSLRTLHSRACSFADPATKFQIWQAWWSDLYQTYRKLIYKSAHIGLSTVKQKQLLGLYKWGSKHGLFSPHLKSQISIVMMEPENQLEKRWMVALNNATKLWQELSPTLQPWGSPFSFTLSPILLGYTKSSLYCDV